jgi:hypothetical protein
MSLRVSEEKEMGKVKRVTDIVWHIRNKILDTIGKRKIDKDELEKITGKSYSWFYTLINKPYSSFTYPDIVINELIEIADSLEIELEIE